MASIRNLAILLSLFTILSLFVYGDKLFPGENWESGIMDLGNGGDDIHYILFKCRHEKEREKKLIVWFQGGPGCSGWIGNLMELGPYTYNSSLNLSFNQNSWNELGDLLFVDQPVGSGFSKMKDEAHNCRNETCVAKNMYTFLLRLVLTHEVYQGKPLYLIGQSFAGQYIPAIAAYLVKANNPMLRLKGIGLGNGVEDFGLQISTHPRYGYENNLLSFSEMLFQQVDASLCQTSLYTKSTKNYTFCWNTFNEMGKNLPNPNDIREKGPYKQIGELIRLLKTADARKQLQVGDRNFLICNASVEAPMLISMYDYTLEDLNYVTNQGIPVMIYHGDKDAVCNWIGGELVADRVDWFGKSEYSKQQYKDIALNKTKTCGAMKSYKNLAYIRVADSGHFAPYNQPECASMLVKLLMNSFVNE